MKPILIVALSALVVGCAAPAVRWEKPGASRAAVDEAMQECRMQARLSPQPRLGSPAARSGTTGAMDRIEDRDARDAERFRACMRERGYSAGTG